LPRWEEALEDLADRRCDERKLDAEHDEYSDDKDRDKHLESTKASDRSIRSVEEKDEERV
jgi:hypothetical protein